MNGTAAFDVVACLSVESSPSLYKSLRLVRKRRILKTVQCKSTGKWRDDFDSHFCSQLETWNDNGEKEDEGDIIGRRAARPDITDS